MLSAMSGARRRTSTSKDHPRALRSPAATAKPIAMCTANAPATSPAARSPDGPGPLGITPAPEVVGPEAPASAPLTGPAGSAPADAVGPACAPGIIGPAEDCGAAGAEPAGGTVPAGGEPCPPDPPPRLPPTD